MSKEQKQLFIIASGIILLIFVVIGNMNAAKKKKAALAPVPAQPVAAAKEEKKKELAFVPADSEKLQIQKKRAEIEWGKDPFVSEIEKGEHIAELKLKGISFGKDKSGFVFINDQILKKGDKIGEYEVMDIFKDKVLIKKGNQTFYLAFTEQDQAKK